MPVNMDISSSLSLFKDKKDFNPDSHFRWSSIKKFLYLAGTFSASLYNFDIFSKIVHKVRIFEFVLCEITIGMSYMFMDCFSKQYTRKLNAHKFLNPLLKGITYGFFLQTALFALIHAVYVADSLRFLASSLQEVPSWSECNISVNNSCVSSKDVILRCQDQLLTYFNTTAAHFHYMKSFKYLDRNVLTTRFFVIGLVWMLNFFFSTVTDDTILKIFKITCLGRSFSTVITIILILITTKYNAVTAFIQILDVNAPNYYTVAVEHVTYTYGIGFLGFYDFGTMSPYTMIDNAVIIFTLMFTAIAFLRSWIVRVLYLLLTKCVAVELTVSPHYLLFAILPLSTEFMDAHRLYTFYIYLNLIVATTAHLIMLTLTMTRLLQGEFRSVKNIYIVGLLCVLGFGLSLPLTLTMATGARGLITGINICVLYLGGFKVAVIMWVYGVQRFSTDIQFWLGFKPTKLWKLCWVLMPIALMVFLFTRIYTLTQSSNTVKIVMAVVWSIFSLLTVAIFQIKTIAKYLVLNNLAAAFSSSGKYGPPDSEDRKRRRNFNETIQLRHCKHNCHLLDETMECNHLPLIQTDGSVPSEESKSSVTNIFKQGSSKIRTSVALEFDSHH